jgi:DNA-binding NarL/FixJ family response regulator
MTAPSTSAVGTVVVRSDGGPGPVRVVLAEDNALLRLGLTRLIQADDALDLVGVATDLPSLLALVEGEDPQVVVTDIRMPLSERAVEKHTNSIFAKLGLSEERDINRRVSAVLLYLHDGRGNRPA